jgi:TRAP-type mannitol/chloroaromatic compound transport system substrate-binding protein
MPKANKPIDMSEWFKKHVIVDVDDKVMKKRITKRIKEELGIKPKKKS